MIVNRGGNKSMTLRNTTVDGVLISVYALAAATNTAITMASFTPENVTVKVELRRNGVITQIMQDNLKILGLFSSLNYGLRDWVVGNKLTVAAVGVYEEMLANCFLRFAGPLNLKGDDELTVQVLVSGDTFAAALNQSDSYVSFEPNEAASAYEKGVPQFFSQVVQANITKETYHLGDHVNKIMFLNFDKTTIATANQVISSLALSSMELDKSMNFYDVMNRDRNVYAPPRIEERYTTTAFDAGTLAYGYLKLYPQSFTLFANVDGRTKALNKTKLDISYRGSNVTVNQNYICAERVIVTKESFRRGQERAEKHAVENYDKLPEGEKGIATV